MKQVSRGFSWKRLYHYLSIYLLTSEQYAPRVAMSLTNSNSWPPKTAKVGRKCKNWA
jgi:hypothetical protein